MSDSQRHVPKLYQGQGAWVARHADRSGLCIFASELEALRHAVSNHMLVFWIPYGQDALTWEGVTPPESATICREGSVTDTTQGERRGNHSREAEAPR